MSTTAERYSYWRRTCPGLNAAGALSYVRAEAAQRELLARFGEWEFAPTAYGAFASAELIDAPDPYRVRVVVGDDDQPVEWGDLEPTDAEREHASAFYVAVQVLDHDGAELYHDGIGGVDVIDLPGYLQRDWEDAAAYALSEYLLDDALAWAANEASESAHWAARDVVTVSEAS